MTFEEALVSVWRQSLDEHLNIIELDGQRFPVRRTQRHRLRQVDFKFEEQALRGLEQNPDTKSRWAELARDGQRVMQFLAGGKYIGNVADGKLTLYKTAGGAGSASGPPDSKPPAKGAATS